MISQLFQLMVPILAYFNKTTELENPTISPTMNLSFNYEPIMDLLPNCDPTCVHHVWGYRSVPQLAQERQKKSQEEELLDELS